MYYHFIVQTFLVIAMIFALFFLIDQVLCYKKACRELAELEAEQLDKMNLSKERREIDLTKM